jgi:hypothetical protein
MTLLHWAPRLRGEIAGADCSRLCRTLALLICAGISMVASPDANADMVVMLSAPERAPPGGRLMVTVQVSDAAAATGGEAVLSFDQSVLGTADQAPGTVSIHLSPNGSGGLSGTAGFAVAASAGGSTDIWIVNGSALMPDGSSQSFDTSAAAATVRIGS